jgi:DNA-binding LytR/AlgR family response regulator
MSQKALNVLIVEDDLSFGLELEMLVQEIGYQLAARVDNAEAAQDIIYQELPDLVLMDIDLNGKMTGLQLGERISHLDIPIIYITSYADEQSYQQAQQSKLIAYLVKPISGFSLKVAIETAVRNVLSEDDAEHQNFLSKNYLFFQRKGIYQKVYMRDIFLVKSSDNYCEVYSQSGEEFILRSSISKMEQLLPSEEFMRVHRQYIVQLREISSIDLQNNLLKLHDKSIPISRRNKKALEEVMIKLN